MASQTGGGGLTLDEFRKSVPQGWKPGMEKYPYKHYLDKLKSMGLTGELRVTSDDNVLKTTYDIEEKAHRDELVTALKDQDLWGWE